MKNPSNIKLTLKKSPIGNNIRQRKTLAALGLKKLNSTRLLKDTLQIRGMIKKVYHLIEVESV